MIGDLAPNKSMTAPDWGLLLTLSVLWGGSFFFVAVAADELPPLTVVVLRVLYFRILATAGATNLLLVTFLIPVSAVLLGILVLGERLAPNHLMGMALIGLGLAVIDGRAWRAIRAARSSGVS